MSLSEELSKIEPKAKSHERILTSYHKQAKSAEILLDIKDHAGITAIMEMTAEIINGINAKLLSGEPMTEIEREKLLTDRERCEWLVNLFPNAQLVINKVQSFIDKYNKR